MTDSPTTSSAFGSHSVPPEPARPEALRAIEAATGRLRAEVDAVGDDSRRARLLLEIGELEERARDEGGAASDYLEALAADPSLRESAESLIRLFERRRSLKHMGRVVDSLYEQAASGEDRIRALTLKALLLADASGDAEAAFTALSQAAEEEGAPQLDLSTARFMTELFAAKTGNAGARLDALIGRTRTTGDPTWRALLLVDAARLLSGAGRHDEALSILEECAAPEGHARFATAQRAEAVARRLLLSEAAEVDRARVTRALGASLEAQARTIGHALEDAPAGNDEGVPRRVRTAAHMAHAALRAAEAFREAGEVARGGKVLDEAIAHPSITAHDAVDPVVRARLITTRIRFAEETGETELASKLAEERIAVEEDGGMRAALALRMAEHSASIGDALAAQSALTQAAVSDPTSVPARALAIDLAATGGEAKGFAAEIESLAGEMPTPEAAARAHLFAAVVYAVEARDESSAKIALARAAERGASLSVVGELARSLASVVGSSTWYDEGTRRLLSTHPTANGGDPRATRTIEMIRGRLLRGDIAGAATLLNELSLRDPESADSGGVWLGTLLVAFLPSGQDPAISAAERTAALDRLAKLETRSDVRLGIGLLAARSVAQGGELAAARTRLAALLEGHPTSVLVALCLSNIERSLGSGREAAATLRAAAGAARERDLAAALELEAAFLLWDSGARGEALEAFDASAEHVPELSLLARAWAGRGLAGRDIEARARAVDDAETVGEDASLAALERFAIGLAKEDAGAAQRALESLEESADGDLAIAGAIARLAVPFGADDEVRFMQAATRLAMLGGRAETLAAAERFALVRTRDPQQASEAASQWFNVGGGVTSALEWLGAAIASGSGVEEARARRALGEVLGGDAMPLLDVSAALIEYLAGERRADAAPLEGSTDAVRLANLELAPPGSDPRRREAALRNVGTALGDEAQLDALSLSGWSLLVAGETERAARTFEHAASVRPADIAAWEGLRSASETLGDNPARARAATELGQRCGDKARAAGFFEEAGVIYAELGDEAAAEAAFNAAFEKDPTRTLSFDKLFRKIRERREGERLLAIIQRRLEASDDPTELSKLFWEQARVLREKGEVDGALRALENVTMFEPDHVGALALTGEIFIKRGEFDEAARKLAGLAALTEAPAKSRLTAGIAAVDLYENKLDRFDLALDVLILLHKAGLSTLPVRERLARAAARTGAWNEAIAILEQLMQERSEPSGRVEAARLAMAIHRDRLRAPERAAGPVLKLLEEAPGDGEAIDMLLGLELPEADKEAQLAKARAVLLTTLRVNPVDPANTERLVRVCHALGDEEGESVALSISAAFGSVGAASSLSSMNSKKPRVPEVALTDDRFAALLAPGDDGPLATLFAMLGSTLAEALGPSLSVLGVGKRDKVDPKSGLALRNEIAAWAGAFGLPSFDLFIGGREGSGVQGVPGEQPALVLGPEIKSPLDARSKARVARELLGLVRGTTVLRLRDDTTAAAIVVAACRLADVPIEAPAYSVLGEVEKALSKAISRRIRKAIHDVCREIAASRPDTRDFRRRALASQARVAVFASADVSFVLGEMLEGSLERVQGSLRADERATELLRFVLSPTYVELRRSLGLERS